MLQGTILRPAQLVLRKAFPSTKVVSHTLWQGTNGMRDQDRRKRTPVVEPLFVLRYVKYKVILRLILASCFLAFLGGGTVLIASKSSPGTALADLDWLLYVLGGAVISAIILIDIVDLLFFEEIRVYKDRVVKVWGLGLLGAREVKWADARFEGYTMPPFNHKRIYLQHGNTMWSWITGVTYDEYLTDRQEARTLNRILAELSGRNVQEFEAWRIRVPTFVKKRHI
jgi:hypothetical protein